MREIIINDDNMTIDDIKSIKKKSRAILINDNKILVGIYDDVVMLPGGGADNDEDFDDALIRELKEEIGIDYNIDDFNKVLNIKYYQKDYPKRSGKIVNRLVSTNYYIGKYKGIKTDNTALTDEELSVDFKIELLTKKEIEEKLWTYSTNLKKPFFDREMEEILKFIEL